MTNMRHGRSLHALAPTFAASLMVAGIAACQQINDSSASTADSAAGASSKAQKLALIVGINDYQAVTKLRGCVSDAKNMQLLLTGKYEFPKEDVVLLLDKEATHAAIVKAFQEHLIGRADRDAIVVFHFSGHGSQMKDDGNEEVDGMDETIVPVDSRTAGVYDITDDEINGLFQELTKKTKNVTFILDCCHSGGNVKVPELVRRAPPDTRPPPAPAAYARAVANGERGDYVLIAGCKADEVSFEFTDPLSKQPCGALTYFFVQAVKSANAEQSTYRDIMDQVQAQVTRAYPSQHPQIEGADADNFVFNSKVSVPEPFVLASPEGDKLRLDAGEAQGIMVGSLFDVYAPGTKDFDDRPALTRIEITADEAFSATGKLLKPAAVPALSRAVLRQCGYPEQRIGVYFLNPGSNSVFAGIRSALESQDERIDRTHGASPRFRDVYEVVSQPNQARILVEQITPDEFNRLNAKGELADLPSNSPMQVVVMAADGTILSTVPASDPDVKGRVLSELAQWGKWFQLRDVRNPSPSRIKIEFTVKPLKGRDARAPVLPDLALASGEKIVFTVRNNGQQDVYFTILDFSSDGSIGIVYPPAGNQELLTKNVPEWSDQTVTFLPAGRKRVRDTLKLVATTSPIDFTFLRQERIKGLPKDPKSLENPLTRILGSAAYIERNVAPTTTNTDDWTTAERIVEVLPAAP
jgi:Caspase domain